MRRERRLMGPALAGQRAPPHANQSTLSAHGVPSWGAAPTTVLRGEGVRLMAEGMAADGPQAGLTEQLKDALYQAYQQFVVTHRGEVSPATATHGVLAATAHILVAIHGQVSPDEEALVSWDAYKGTCVVELDRRLREPQTAHGGDER
ncbi:MAG: hypothetical protein M3361_02585 [Candidatus Tectomicrobia bacterium]|nr:hypothetical protein [Candidatus Tectomicrobia bacterium]